MKITIEIPKSKLLFLLVPNSIEKFAIVNYGHAGTYLMENNSGELNAWKMKIPNGKYDIIGKISDQLFNNDDLSECDDDTNFILRVL